MTSLVGYDYDSDDSDKGELGAQELAEALAQAGPPQRAESGRAAAAEAGSSAKPSVGQIESRQLLSPDRSSLQNESDQGKSPSQRSVKPSLGTHAKPNPLMQQQQPADQPSRVILPSAADLLGDSPDSLSFAIGTVGRGGPSGGLQGPAGNLVEASRKRTEPNPNMLLPKPPLKALKGGSGAGVGAGAGAGGRGGRGGRGGGLGASADSFLPPQLRGRSNVATEDLDRIFSKKGKHKQ
ncbi:hypothetical protein CLOM_g7225 [Closterium sp. NIES-68]|nr:hypothetical protein CLOM_g438 [Closterium sp. NIES-68]GJP47982.1 hypothetical protein CLOM_g7225 [Closterium sp. NIES-68]GJP64395.1 hypothetical protein CLOP_g21393 [Closterium sp. NIES-67]